MCVGGGGSVVRLASDATVSADKHVHRRTCACSLACPQVKLWAKANGINDAASHTFNSWCITLLVRPSRKWGNRGRGVG